MSFITPDNWALFLGYTGVAVILYTLARHAWGYYRINVRKEKDVVPRKRDELYQLVLFGLELLACQYAITYALHRTWEAFSRLGIFIVLIVLVMLIRRIRRKKKEKT